jgi:hypothetical protein
MKKREGEREEKGLATGSEGFEARGGGREGGDDVVALP